MAPARGGNVVREVPRVPNLEGRGSAWSLPEASLQVVELLPQDAGMANGSRRTLPTAPAAAAVVAEAMIEPRSPPWVQSRASVTRGTAAARRPPKRIAGTGTRLGSPHSGAMTGHCAAGAVKR